MVNKLEKLETDLEASEKYAKSLRSKLDLAQLEKEECKDEAHERLEEKVHLSS